MWYQLQIDYCQPDEAELLSDLLENAGAVSVTFTDKADNPVLEPAPGTMPLWPSIIIQALFTSEEEAVQAQALLSNTYPGLNFLINFLADQDWERVCLQDFKPLRFGKKLWVCPSWIEPPEPENINLILDPGLAFGTGTHQTTSLCLTWLEQAPLATKSVIDYGCGSGILALAALKLGAAYVQAIDFDEQALQATLNNALSNNITKEQLRVGFPSEDYEAAELIIANILLEPLLSLQSRFKELLQPQGTLVVSGLLTAQVPELIKAYEKDLKHEYTKTLEDWALVVFKNIT